MLCQNVILRFTNRKLVKYSASSILSSNEFPIILDCFPTSPILSFGWRLKLLQTRLNLGARPQPPAIPVLLHWNEKPIQVWQKKKKTQFHFSKQFSPEYSCLTRATSSLLECGETFQRSQTTSVSSGHERGRRERRTGAQQLPTWPLYSLFFSELSLLFFELLSLTVIICKLHKTGSIYINKYCLFANYGWYYKMLSFTPAV